MPKSITISLRLQPAQLAQIIDCLRGRGQEPLNLSSTIKQALNIACQSMDATSFNRSPTPQAYALIETWTTQNRRNHQARSTSTNWGNNPTGQTPQTAQPTNPELSALSTYNIQPIINLFPKEDQNKAKNVWSYLASGHITIADNLVSDNPEAALITAQLLSESGLLTIPPIDQHKAQVNAILDSHQQEVTNEPITNKPSS